MIFLLACFASISTAFASSYSERQLDALAERVGRTYWVASVNNRTPSFLSAVATKASSFRVEPNESFEITELVGRKTDHPYYKVKFASEAAIQRRPVPGMKTGEVNKILGKPTRVTKIQAPQRFGEEHWFYPDGSVVIFQNGLLIRIEPKEKKD